MSIKDFIGGIFFIGLAGYFTFMLVDGMSELFVDTTTLWQYFVAFFRVALIIFLFNLGLTLIKRFFAKGKTV
ncbi:sulfate permease [Lysinibacillus sp. 2017]|uniref:sulfate permease n=1 Tax=unclassified Lysinibacillus TaxID=2636778 RepID=UPI000D529D38|nr:MULTISPECIES: sulfate permease [unclassified Lysinibacillus]AWE06226.1 sulfate permease [Lysinibacillus sp. 2017]TGN35298.1 sulfate permease [Lysinibacillus sp. S2017]